MAPFTQKQGSISTTDSSFEPLSIFEITKQPFEQFEFEEHHTENGVHSTLRVDSHEHDGNIAIEMLRH